MDTNQPGPSNYTTLNSEVNYNNPIKRKTRSSDAGSSNTAGQESYQRLGIGVGRTTRRSNNVNSTNQNGVGQVQASQVDDGGGSMGVDTGVGGIGGMGQDGNSTPGDGRSPEKEPTRGEEDNLISFPWDRAGSGLSNNNKRARHSPSHHNPHSQVPALPIDPTLSSHPPEPQSNSHSKSPTTLSSLIKSTGRLPYPIGLTPFQYPCLTPHLPNPPAGDPLNPDWKPYDPNHVVHLEQLPAHVKALSGLYKQINLNNQVRARAKAEWERQGVVQNPGKVGISGEKEGSGPRSVVRNHSQAMRGRGGAGGGRGVGNRQSLSSGGKNGQSEQINQSYRPIPLTNNNETGPGAGPSTLYNHTVQTISNIDPTLQNNNNINISTPHPNPSHQQTQNYPFNNSTNNNNVTQNPPNTNTSKLSNTGDGNFTNDHNNENDNDNDNDNIDNSQIGFDMSYFDTSSFDPATFETISALLSANTDSNNHDLLPPGTGLSNDQTGDIGNNNQMGGRNEENNHPFQGHFG